MPQFNLTERSLSKAQLEQKRQQASFFPNQIATGSFVPHVRRK